MTQTHKADGVAGIPQAVARFLPNPAPAIAQTAAATRSLGPQRGLDPDTPRLWRNGTGTV